MVDILGHKKRALHDKAVMPLIESLQDPDIEVQRDAADALGKIGDPRAIVPLGDKISDSDAETRAVARHALHDVVDESDEDAVDPLVRLLQHEDPMVRETAATELGDLAQPVTEKVTESVSEAAGAAGEKLQPVAEKAKDVGEQAAQKASETYDKTKSKVEEVQREKPITERVKETASSVSERVHLTDEKTGEQVQQAYTESSGDVLPATPEHDMDYHKVPEETRARQHRKKTISQGAMPATSEHHRDYNETPPVEAQQLSKEPPTGTAQKPAQGVMPAAVEHDIDYQSESEATRPPKEQGKKKEHPEQTDTLNTKEIGTIQVLYYSDCPHYLQTSSDVKKTLSEGGLSADVQLVDLARSPEIAREVALAGSPTVLVNGKDIAPPGDHFAGPTRGNCRLYDYNGEVYDYPPKELIREALTSESRRKMKR